MVSQVAVATGRRSPTTLLLLLQQPTQHLRSFTTKSSSPTLQIIGLRRENKNRWERRVPLLPHHVAQLIKETGTKVLVQPSTKRIIPDEAYEKAGATITEDLGQADVILGIKEVPIDQLIQKTFMIFSHTHKSQDYNMPTLQAVLDKNIRLLDYELLVDPQSKKRLVLFGQYAGYAGMIDCFHGLGQRLLGLGYNTPFIHIPMSHMCHSLKSARWELNTIGEMIRENGLPKDFGPFVFVFTGSGNVSQGAQSIFRELPHEYVDTKDLPAQFKGDKRPADYNQNVYGVVVNAPDYLVRKEGGQYDRTEYRTHPDRYQSVFFDRIAPYATVLVNGLFWSTEFPRLMTTKQLKQFQSKPENKHRLLALMDITCDIGGSFEFMSHASTIGDPFFYVDAAGPAGLRQHKDIESPGIQINSVDNLPTELPLEASTTFADALYPFVKAMALNQFDDPVLANARITEFGKNLLPPYQHLLGKLEGLRTDSSQSSSSRNDGRQKVLVVGSGRVVGPLIEYLHDFPNIDIQIASNQYKEAERLATGFERVAITGLDVEDSVQLDSLIQCSDVVVRLSS